MNRIGLISRTPKTNVRFEQNMSMFSSTRPFVFKQTSVRFRGPLRFLSLPFHLVQHRDGERDGQQERAEVGHGLTHLYALKPQVNRENQDEGNEEKALTGRRKDDRTYRLADGLQHHVTQDDPHPQGKRDELPPQGPCTGLDDVDVIAEPRHDFGRVDVAHDGTNGQKDHAQLDAEKKPARTRL